MRVISASDLVNVELEEHDDVRSRAVASVTVGIAGVTMRLHSDQAELCAAFARRFRAHCSNRTADIDYFVGRGRAGHLFFGDGAPVLCWPHGDLPVPALLFLADAAAMSALIRSDERLVSYHAAVVERDGAAAAIVADSDGGKTTTSLACARIGMRVYSDERLIVRDALAQAFLRTCNVRPDGKRRLLEDERFDVLAQALTTEMPGNLSFLDVFGERAAAPPAPLRAVFLLHKDGSGRAAATPIPTHDALPAMMRWAHARSERLALVARTARMLSEAACYRLSLGTPHETARCIDEALAR